MKKEIRKVAIISREKIVNETFATKIFKFIYNFTKTKKKNLLLKMISYWTKQEIIDRRNKRKQENR